MKIVNCPFGQWMALKFQTNTHSLQQIDFDSSSLYRTIHTHSSNAMSINGRALKLIMRIAKEIVKSIEINLI